MTARRLLGTLISGEAGRTFPCDIYMEDTGRVYVMACASVDADGANGQHGRPSAYMADDSGSDSLAAGGMQLDGAGRVVCAHPWAKDVVILGPDGQPKIFDGGLIASKTWYRDRTKDADDPSAYVDAETVPYVVVPPLVVQQTRGIVRGCKAKVSWQGMSVDCVVADLGPHGRVGELSIAAARALSMRSSPRNGGVGTPEVLYELWPGIAVPGFELQRA